MFKHFTGAMMGLLTLAYSASGYCAINVFACEPEWAALSNALGGKQVQVFAATSAQQDPHHIQARPSLIAKTRRADLLVCTGAELETGWLPLLLRKSANQQILPGQKGHFMAADQVQLLEKPEHLDRSEGDVHAAGNPHIHLDPQRMLRIARSLSKVLAQLDADNSSYYQSQLAHFERSWSAAMARWAEQARQLKGKKIVVNHNSWVYLEQWLGLERLTTLEPKPGVAPSSSYLAQVLNQLKNNKADMILYADYQSVQAVNWLSSKTDTPVVALPFSVNRDETLEQWFDRLLGLLTKVR